MTNNTYFYTLLICNIAMNSCCNLKVLFLPVLMLLLLAASIKAQEYAPNHYIGERVNYTAEKLYTNYAVDCYRSAKTKVDGHIVRIRKNRSGKVYHIGFEFFPDDMIDQPSATVHRFIESYLLYLYLLKDDAEIHRQMQEDKVQIHFQGKPHKGQLQKRLIESLPLTTPDRTFTIHMNESKYTAACTEKEKPLFEIIFPINYQLLSGMNKKESEQAFYEQLATATGLPCPDQAISATAPERIGANCYIQRGEIYQIESMNNHRYYILDGVFKQLSDTLQAAKSIHNLFTMHADKMLETDISLQLYGGKQIGFSTPLCRLLEFCREEGCEIFAGIEQENAGAVKGTAILLNRTQGYSHTLSFEVNPQILTHPESHRMKADLYLFAPIHNIETLYYENEP